jgi:hypothetical protein
MIYTLKVQTEGVWHVLDLNDSPAMNYQSSDLAELKDFNASYSQNLKLPLTQNNVKILDYVNLMYVTSDIPYRRIPCKLYCNERLIISRNAFFVLLSVSDVINCQILSGTADFFETLKSKKMSEMDLGVYDRTNRGLLLPNNRFISMGVSIQQEGGTFIADREKMLPFVYTLPVFEQMIADMGYKLTHDMEDIRRVDCMSCGSMRATERTFAGYTLQLIARNFESGYLALLQKGFETSWIVENSVNEGKMLRTTFDGTLSLRVTTKSNIDTAVTELTRLFVRNRERNLILASEYLYLSNSEIIWTLTDIPFIEGEDLIIDTNYSMSEARDFEVLIEVIDVKPRTEKVPIGGELEISSALNFDNQFEFFKSFSLAHGLFIDVDHATKTVNAITFDKVLKNKSKALDWSDKVHENANINFTPKNYARNNVIKFEQNKNGFTDSYAIALDNENIPASRDLISFSHPSGGTDLYTGQWIEFSFESNRAIRVASLNLFNADGEFQEQKSTLLKFDHSLMVRAKYSESLYEEILSRVVPRTAEEIGRAYYGWLPEVFDRAQIVEENILITEDDILSFSQDTPIYLKKHGAFFYVNKIVNFVAGKPTKCELIKI